MQLAHACIGICALCIAAILVHREFFQPTVASGIVHQGLAVQQWSMFAILGQRIGPEDAERVVVEFSDFQCPFCASVQPLLEDALRQSDRHLAIAYVHFPLDQIHPHAVAAAVASNCAAAQGRFVAMHNHLFAHQSRIGVEPWQVAATRAGVPDTIAFRKCLSNNRERELVQKQAALGKEIGVRGTPSFIIDGKLYSGIPPSELRRLLLRRTSQN